MTVRVGISGWRYPPWRGDFYPEGCRSAASWSTPPRSSPRSRSTARSTRCSDRRAGRSGAREVPDDFVFAVKGGRFITHMKRLRDVEVPLANFFAQGVLALGPSSARSCGSCPPTFPRTSEVVRDVLRRSCRGPRPRPPSSRAGTTTEAVRATSCGRATSRSGRCDYALEPRHRASSPTKRSPLSRMRRGAGRGRLGREVAALRAGDRPARLCPAARRQGALRQRLHRHGARHMGRAAARLDRRRPRRLSSTSTTT